MPNHNETTNFLDVYSDLFDDADIDTEQCQVFSEIMEMLRDSFNYDDATMPIAFIKGDVNSGVSTLLHRIALGIPKLYNGYKITIVCDSNANVNEMVSMLDDTVDVSTSTVIHKLTIGQCVVTVVNGNYTDLSKSHFYCDLLLIDNAANISYVLMDKLLCGMMPYPIVCGDTGGTNTNSFYDRHRPVVTHMDTMKTFDELNILKDLFLFQGSVQFQEKYPVTVDALVKRSFKTDS